MLQPLNPFYCSMAAVQAELCPENLHNLQHNSNV